VHGQRLVAQRLAHLLDEGRGLRPLAGALQQLFERIENEEQPHAQLAGQLGEHRDVEGRGEVHAGQRFAQLRLHPRERRALPVADEHRDLCAALAVGGARRSGATAVGEGDHDAVVATRQRVAIAAAPPQQRQHAALEQGGLAGAGRAVQHRQPRRAQQPGEQPGLFVAGGPGFGVRNRRGNHAGTTAKKSVCIHARHGLRRGAASGCASLL
jgi:hypothetical protein